MKKTLKRYKKTGMVRGHKANSKMNKEKVVAKVQADRMRKGSKYKEYGPQMTKVPKV